MSLPLPQTSAADPARPIGWLSLAHRLFKTVRELNPGISPRALWRTCKLLALKVRWLGSFRNWHSDAANPALNEMVRQRPSLMLAVSRPYINDHWTASQRLDAIWDHYSLLSGPLHFLRFEPGARVCLAKLDARSMPLQIVLDKPTWIPCEGELGLHLFSGEQRLYSLAFSLGRLDSQPAAYVGALQGLGDARALDIYRDITHELHGLRPRDLLLNSFRMFCARLDVERIRAVSDACSPCRSSYFRKSIPASYDAAWTEHHGVPDGRGFFELSASVTRRPSESIPSRKRAQYRRRYQMYDDLERQIDLAVRQEQQRMAATTSRVAAGERTAKAAPSAQRTI